MNKGKLIVIDGADGCGKATQTRLLLDILNKTGRASETIDFPRKESFFGKLIYEGLDGKYGDFKSLHPKLASTFWAADRYLASAQINAWLHEGRNVIADRYVSANQIHQGGKIKDETERKEFLLWLDEMEYGEYKIPRPSIVLYLDVPYEVSLALMQARKLKEAELAPVKGDQHENDPEHQLAARESGVKMLSDKSWRRIECSEDGKTMLSVESIHAKILEHVLSVL